MTPSDRVRTYYDRVWSAGETAWAHEFFASVYFHNLTPRTPAELAAAARAFHARFAEVQVYVDRLIERDEFVITRVTYSATHVRDWHGRETSGQRVQLTALDVFRFEDGVVVEHLHESDHERLWVQLGVKLPPP